MQSLKVVGALLSFVTLIALWAAPTALAEEKPRYVRIAAWRTCGWLKSKLYGAARIPALGPELGPLLGSERSVIV